ncbi:hypothetical protein Nepgr_007602 [Nepenthes gracilis]|uniref:Uncharacterized protein n=1 Tax=Nepenthes gracilis TaxID=150966 RepID=A0AAD3S836_NEPGR|nr:hypothetical protein Nepgr_007602 [Nepenthes gracilis]
MRSQNRWQTDMPPRRTSCQSSVSAVAATPGKTFTDAEFIAMSCLSLLLRTRCRFSHNSLFMTNSYLHSPIEGYSTSKGGDEETGEERAPSTAQVMKQMEEEKGRKGSGSQASDPQEKEVEAPQEGTPTAEGTADPETSGKMQDTPTESCREST